MFHPVLCNNIRTICFFIFYFLAKPLPSCAGPFYAALDAFEANDILTARTHFEVLEKDGSILASAFLSEINALENTQVPIRFDLAHLPEDQKVWLEATKDIRLHRLRPKKKELLNRIEGHASAGCGHAYWYLGTFKKNDRFETFHKAICGGDFRAAINLRELEMEKKIPLPILYIFQNFRNSDSEKAILSRMEPHMKPGERCYSDTYSPGYLMLGSMVGLGKLSLDNARSLHNWGHLLDAQTYARTAIAQGYPEGLIVLALIAKNQNRMDDAKDYYTQAAAQNLVAGIKGIGVLEFRLGNHDIAEKWFQKLINTNDPEGNIYLADFYVSLIRPDQDPTDLRQKAAAHLKTALHKGSQDPEHMFRYATLCRHLGQLDDMEIWFEKAAQQGHHYAIYNMGELWYHKNDKEKALEYFLQGNDLGIIEAGRSAARILIELQKNDEAEKILLSLDEKTPYNPDIAFALGAFYAKKSNWKKAKIYSRRAVSLGHFYAQTNLANAYRGLGKDSLAKIYYYRALAGGDVMAALNLAQVYIVQHNAQKALEIIQPFMDQGNSHVIPFYKALMAFFPELRKKEEVFMEVSPENWEMDSDSELELEGEKPVTATSSDAALPLSPTVSEEDEPSEAEFEQELKAFETENAQRYADFRAKKVQQRNALSQYVIALAPEEHSPFSSTPHTLSSESATFIDAVFGKNHHSIHSYRMDEVRHQLTLLSKEIPELHLEDHKSDNHALKITGLDPNGYRHMLTLHNVHGTQDRKLYRDLGIRIRTFLTQLGIKP